MVSVPSSCWDLAGLPGGWFPENMGSLWETQTLERNRASSSQAFPLTWSQVPLPVWKAIIYGLFLIPDHRCPSFINLSLFLLSAIARNWSTFKMSLILVLQCHNLTVIGVASTGSPSPEIDGVQLTNYILSILVIKEYVGGIQ